jgi:hypothetical protein
VAELCHRGGAVSQYSDGQTEHRAFGGGGIQGGVIGRGEALGEQVEFVLANVLQMPLPPKAYRRKTDKIDTGRIQREYLNGSLPRSYQPTIWWRQVRRLVDSRQDLIERQTAVKNWIRHFLYHETWEAWESLCARSWNRTTSSTLSTTKSSKKFSMATPNGQPAKPLSMSPRRSPKSF